MVLRVVTDIDLTEQTVTATEVRVRNVWVTAVPDDYYIGGIVFCVLVSLLEWPKVIQTIRVNLFITPVNVPSIK